MKYQVLLALVASANAIKIDSDFERHHNVAHEVDAKAITSQLDDIKNEGDAAIQKIREMGNQKVH